MQPADLDVLIVDDHEAMRALLARILARTGVVSVRTAETGAAALAALSERPATLILADRNMPGMGGLAFVQTVRAEAAYGAPRIIVISGNVGSEHAEAARSAGADAVLVKPVSARDLLAAIETLFAV